MALVLPVARAAVEEILVGHRGAVGEVVRERADLFDHVEHPENVRVVRASELLVFRRAVVLVVVESFDVNRHDLAAVRREVRHLVDNERRTCHALIRPVVGAARCELLERGLPQELAGGLAKCHQHAAVARLFGIADRLVIGTHNHDPAAHGGIPVGLRAKLGDPLHVLPGLDVPGRGKARQKRDHVAAWCATPHRPVGRHRDGRGHDEDTHDDVAHVGAFRNQESGIRTRYCVR